MRSCSALILIAINALNAPVWAGDSLSGSVKINNNRGSFIVNWECTVKAVSSVTLDMRTSPSNDQHSTDQSAASTEIGSVTSCEELLLETDDIDGDGVVDIAVNTTNSGLHKSRSIFLFDSAKNTFIYAGVLPIAADFVAPYTYRLIESQGGSMFETLIKIQDKKIRTYPQRELVLEGEICVSNSRRVISSASICPGLKVSATWEHPICIDHRSVTPHVVSQTECKKLLFLSMQ